MTQHRITTTALLFLISCTLAQGPVPEIVCTPGCNKCEKAQSLRIDTGLTQLPTVDGACTGGCIRALVNHKTFKCVESSIVSTKKTKCLIFDEDNVCVRCERGYALVENVCVPHKIDKCEFAYGSSPIDLYCEVCEDGYPAKDSRSCGGWKLSGKLSQQPVVNNCLSGGRLPLAQAGAKFCYRCKSGFLTKDLSCVKDTSGLTGCLAVNELNPAVCDECDAQNRYYMKNPGKCASM